MQNIVKKLLSPTFYASLVFLLGLTLFSPNFVSAATISFTWKDAQTLTVSGAVNGDLVANAAGSTAFTGSVTGGSCNLMTVTLTMSPPTPVVTYKVHLNNKPASSINPPGTIPCYADVLGVPNDTNVPTRPGGAAVETKDQKRVSIGLLSAKPPDQSPGTVTFTIKDSSGKVVSNPQVAKKLSCQGSNCNASPPINFASYETIVYLDAGKYSICFSALEPCQNFTKVKYTPLPLAYGEIFYNRDINVYVGVKLSAPNPNSCKIGPYTVELKKAGNVIQTAKTNVGEHKGDPGAVGGMTDMTLGLSTTFKNVDAGTYQVCVVEIKQCKDIVKKANQNAPDSLKFDYQESNSASFCAAPGETPAPTRPLPPSPPCKQNAWTNGQCQTFISALGDLGTNPSDFVTKLFGVLLGLSGGIALLLILRAGYQLITSEGKPEQIQNGRDQLIAAIVGLIFLIFALVFLQVIGYDVLRIPGFKPA